MAETTEPTSRDKKHKPTPRVRRPLDPNAALYDANHAASYLGRSPAWLRAKKAEYVKAEEQGRTADLARLPKHVLIGNSVFWRRSDLDKYIADNAVDGGAVRYPEKAGAK